MMNDENDLLFTKTHEWARLDESGEIITMGITDYGQQQLSDITNVDLPEPDDHVYEAGDELGVVESVKAAADYYAPVSGSVVEVNEELVENPELINTDPFGEGWVVKLKIADASELDNLLSPSEYDSLIPDED
jgi:glycine cleavage system H protein